MRWSAGVSNILGDEDLLEAILSRVGYRLRPLDDEGAKIRVLHHEKYQGFESANQVHADSKKLSDLIRQYAEADGIQLGIQFDLIRRHNADGSVSRYMFAEASVVVRVGVTGTVTVTRNPAVSEEEHQKLLDDAAKREDERRRRALVRRAAAALHNPSVLEVIKLMTISEPSATELGHIIDLVQDSCGGNLNNYSSKKQLRRFSRSINHPHVLGLGARHAVTKEAPPADPMSFEEARRFARGIGAAWLGDIEREE